MYIALSCYDEGDFVPYTFTINHRPHEVMSDNFWDKPDYEILRNMLRHILENIEGHLRTVVDCIELYYSKTTLIKVNINY